MDAFSLFLVGGIKSHSGCLGVSFVFGFECFFFLLKRVLDIPERMCLSHVCESERRN